jgi:hypothetical protein
MRRPVNQFTTQLAFTLSLSLNKPTWVRCGVRILLGLGALQLAPKSQMK